VDINSKEHGKVAVACDNDEIIKSFCDAKQLKIFDIENEKIVKQKVVDMKRCDDDSFFSSFYENGIEVLICDAISDDEAKSLHRVGVLIYAGNQGNADELVGRFLRRGLFYDPDAPLSENTACEHCADRRDYRMEIAAEIGSITGHNGFHPGHNRVKGENTGHNQYVAYKEKARNDYHE
jgi:predicted Fe-Mo cluster-binding NifX family protein